MADLEPSYFKIRTTRPGGFSQEDNLKILYNLWKAIIAICNNIDEDVGSTGQDYMTKIGDDLNTVMARVQTPNGDYV
jgi:hypothetical protein